MRTLTFIPLLLFLASYDCFAQVALVYNDDSPLDTQCELWEVSARLASSNKAQACQPCQLPTHKFEDCVWTPASEAVLIEEIEQDPTCHNILYVHGNRTTQEEARNKALALMRALKARSSVPFRVILFTWSSEKPDRLLPGRILEEKRELIEASAFYLAGLMGRLPENRVNSVVGFSFGCAVTSAALHLQAGGSIDGHTLSSDQNRINSCVRLGFIAPAFDRFALTHTGEYREASKLIEVVVNLYNSKDPILKRFRFFDRDNPDAAGLLGLAPSQHQPLAQNGQIIQYDCNQIGRTHAEKDYYSCSKLAILFDNALGKKIER
jgi:hypothetical protein